MRIICNEIDIYKSSIKKKSISEFIIYLMYGDTPVEAYIEYGIDAKNKRITTLISEYRIKNNITNNYLII